jgi:hypothetical protein
MTPLPPLVFFRITEGLFYDFVGSGGSVRNEFSDRYESYCEYLFLQNPNGKLISREIRYGRTANGTPDILVSNGSSTILAVELKARRQTAEVRFGENPTVTDPSLFEELAAGIVQLWKFAAYGDKIPIRDDFKPKSDLLLALCTLDNWIEMSDPILEYLIKMAEAKADAKNIPHSARAYVKIFSVGELEFVLARGGVDALISVVKFSKLEKYQGWLLTSIFSAEFPYLDKASPIPPSESEIERHIPWWYSIQPKR